ncbi:MAG: DUF4430 domain-containing protein [Crenarchaeota archaeon]|nr:DUF4430 domain-containing protein [Thermoproteota archaeon]
MLEDDKLIMYAKLFMKRNTILTAALAVFGLVFIAIGTYFINEANTAKGDGTITIKVIELEDVLVKEKDITFYEGDTLTQLVKSNFSNVVIDNGMVMSIESITTPNDWSTYICIYQNDVMSNVGINDIEFQDGDIVSFVNTVNSY